MKFEDITKEQDLIDYLDDAAERLKGRKYIYHYTNVDRCVDIFTSKLWFLSGAKCMNDQLEYRNGDENRWKNLFFASFMSDVDESIGMWSMYSRPWEKGVQIAIPVKEAKDWVKGALCIREISCVDFKPTGKIIQSDNNNRVFLSAVAYTNCDNNADGEQKITWSTAKNSNFPNASHNSFLTGYVKDSAWDYEKEIRIKASIDNKESFSKVAIDIPDYVLDSIVLTASPLFEGNLHDKLWDSIHRHLKPEPSLFTGRLQLNGSCDMCDKRQGVSN